jgi:hypothetical protein
MHIAECIELYLASDVHGAFTKQLEQTQEAQLGVAAGGPGSGPRPGIGSHLGFGQEHLEVKDAAKEHNFWTRKRSPGSGTRSMTREGGDRLEIAQDGGWTHNSADGKKLGSGHGGGDLHDYLG